MTKITSHSFFLFLLLLLLVLVLILKYNHFHEHIPFTCSRSSILPFIFLFKLIYTTTNTIYFEPAKKKKKKLLKQIHHLHLFLETHPINKKAQFKQNYQNTSNLSTLLNLIQNPSQSLSFKTLSIFLTQLIGDTKHKTMVVVMGRRRHTYQQTNVIKKINQPKSS